MDTNDELVKVVIACNHATMLTKVAKVYVNSDGKNTTAYVEMLLPRAEDFRAVFSRSLTVLKAAVNNFVEKMKEIS